MYNPGIEYLDFDTFRDVTLDEFDFLRAYGFTPVYDPTQNTSFCAQIAFVGRRSAIVAAVDIREDRVDVFVCNVNRGNVIYPVYPQLPKTLWDLFPDPTYVRPSNSQLDRNQRKARRSRQKLSAEEYLRQVYAFDIHILKTRGQSLLDSQR